MYSISYLIVYACVRRIAHELLEELRPFEACILSLNVPEMYEACVILHR